MRYFHYVKVVEFLVLLFIVEHTRVALHPEEGVEGSDYINANYITVSLVVYTEDHSHKNVVHTSAINSVWLALPFFSAARMEPVKSTT